MAEIRLLSPGDEALLQDYDPDAFDDEITDERLTAYLAAPLHKMAIALVNGKAIAQARAVLHLQPDEPLQLYIDNLGVAETFKRQGIATKLIAALMDWGKAQGAQGLWVATEDDNDEALGFYRSLGMAPEAMVFFEAELE